MRKISIVVLIIIILNMCVLPVVMATESEEFFNTNNNDTNTNQNEVEKIEKDDIDDEENVNEDTENENDEEKIEDNEVDNSEDLELVNESITTLKSVPETKTVEEATENVTSTPTETPVPTPTSTPVPTPEPEPSVVYNSYIQSRGWENDYSKKNGEVSGTSGYGIRLEAIKIKLQNTPENSRIEYQVHIQDIGWQTKQSNGSWAGTLGRGLRIEAIKINLKNLPGYTVEYRAHVENIGWQKWKRNGSIAGTTGQGLRLEAIQIRIVENSNVTFEPNAIYKAHVENEGWQGEVGNGNVAGSVGKAQRLEAIQIRIEDLPEGCGVQYRSHVQDIGWQIWKKDGQEAGTTGRGLRMEAIQIQLTNSVDYSISYRAHVESIGWMNWVSDGQVAGTTGRGLRMEAIQIKITKKAALTSGTIGIDVSEHNGDINWNTVKNSTAKFAIIRCGYGKNSTAQDDKKFERNISECIRLGIPYGVYLYSYAGNADSARSEAEHVIRLLNGRVPPLGVWIDIEDADGYKARNDISYDTSETVASTFCSIMTSRGYTAGIYASLDWFNNYLNSSALDKYQKWVAQWNSICTYAKAYKYWQYSSSGSVSGISGRVDMNKVH